MSAKSKKPINSCYKYYKVVGQVEEEDAAGDMTNEIIGYCGRWHVMACTAVALMKLPTAWYQLNIIFLAPPQSFWCEKPAFLKISDQRWRCICSPNPVQPCMIYNFQNKSSYLTPCEKFVYDTSVFHSTIVSEWDLVCSKAGLVHLAQFTMMLGILLGGIIFGLVADRNGRRRSLLVAILLQSANGLFSGFSPGYWWFLGNRFLLALGCGGISVITSVYPMEIVSEQWRSIIPMISHVPFGFANAIMAALSYRLRDWRTLEKSLGLLSTLLLPMWCWVPESPRWLLAAGHDEEALEVMKDAARYNNVPFDETQIRKLIKQRPVNSDSNKSVGFLYFLRSKNMRLTTILLSLNWFCTGLAYYTFSQYLGRLGDDIFRTVALSGIISTSGALLCICVIQRAGRKKTILIFQILTAVCYVLLLMMPTDDCFWWILTFSGIGLAGMAGSVPALNLYTAELYPTLGRNAGVGGVVTFARIGSMVAPFLVTLDSYMYELPLILLAVMTFAQTFLLLPLPETEGRKLPDTLEEAENITKDRKDVRSQGESINIRYNLAPRFYSEGSDNVDDS